MSRGGRGGFGRGGGGAQSGAMQLVSFDLLKDLGSGSLFNVQTALFPEMDVPIPRKSTATEETQWKLRKEYLTLIKNSPFHIQRPPPPPDIERYSDKYKSTETKKRSLRDISTDLDFFPEELMSIIDPSKAKKKRKKQVAQDDFGQLEALLNAEDKDDDGEDNDEEKEEGEGEENEEEYEDEEELVDDNDYNQTYFDNGEGEDMDDDDGDGAGDYM
ncbi:DNA-directed RNA polymerase III, subunit Rpc31 [Radiomyces spectabilis]|uniref:DNA-directed RNA polymerase III, subunit Rpc31 n=1 Tax=Radiomyces spectabilis TaxID=64574 RepID=UPI00221EEEF6|nr:DNA-directed RNA polymerase III, subunit Rpc31 [Radiomyces spectabilis]KAI8379491.1 DNA-directed RNA polymerase III, subunit Rpc31 [Radiomyces spectabilis]